MTTTTGTYRVDYLIPNTHTPQTEFHDTQDAAEVALGSLLRRGVKSAVSWFDSAVYVA